MVVELPSALQDNRNASIACFVVAGIEPLLLLFELDATITENMEKVNRDVVTKAGVK